MGRLSHGRTRTLRSARRPPLSPESTAGDPSVPRKRSKAFRQARYFHAMALSAAEPNRSQRLGHAGAGGTG